MCCWKDPSNRAYYSADVTEWAVCYWKDRHEVVDNWINLTLKVACCWKDPLKLAGCCGDLNGWVVCS